MMKITLEMPKVDGCSVTQCVYNQSNTCNARAITVGDGFKAMCDTFFEGTPHTKSKFIAGVGACKIASCAFNNDYECQADNITIGFASGSAKCFTYSPK
jgi:hypothetical protein